MRYKGTSPGAALLVGLCYLIAAALVVGVFVYALVWALVLVALSVVAGFGYMLYLRWHDGIPLWGPSVARPLTEAEAAEFERSGSPLWVDPADTDDR